jgi:hypothetical protein
VRSDLVKVFSLVPIAVRKEKQGIAKGGELHFQVQVTVHPGGVRRSERGSREPARQHPHIVSPASQAVSYFLTPLLKTAPTGWWIKVREK